VSTGIIPLLTLYAIPLAKDARITRYRPKCLSKCWLVDWVQGMCGPGSTPVAALVSSHSGAGLRPPTGGYGCD